MMKKFGFWLEKGYKARPSIHRYINKNIKSNRRMYIFVSLYLNLSPKLTLSMGWQESIIDKSRLPGEVIRTDGTWVWTDDIVYYYEHNGLELPQEFIENIRKKIFPYPVVFGFKLLFTWGSLKGKIYERLAEELAEEENKLT